MENTKQKHTGSNILIIMLILIILASTGIGLYSWAKYQTTVEGTATGQTAKWSFNVKDKNGEQLATINLAETMNSVDGVAEGKIAPGTGGSFDLIIDGEGSEVAIDYYIKINTSKATTNKPRNLKFYKSRTEVDGKYLYSNEIVDSGAITILDSIELTDNSKTKTQTIYWYWAFETGATNEEIITNDQIDTEDAGKTIILPIKVYAQQRAPGQVGSGMYLADVVEVGDYINYKSSTASASYTTVQAGNPETGSEKSTTFNSTDFSEQEEAGKAWRVLSVDKQTKVVNLISADETANKVAFKGIKGYQNVETVLNNIGAVYGHGEGAQGGRSIAANDIEQYLDSAKSQYEITENKTIGATKQYTSGTFIKGAEYNGQNAVTGGSDNGDGTVTASVGNPVTVIHTYYNTIDKATTLNSFINVDPTNGENKYNMFFMGTDNKNKATYWIASHYAWPGDSVCIFPVGIIGAWRFNSEALYFSSVRDAVEAEYSVTPVVTLESNIQTSGQNENGAWEIF